MLIIIKIGLIRILTGTILKEIAPTVILFYRTRAPG
jgi:hypothetical protein